MARDWLTVSVGVTRTTVSTSPTIAVTCTISALVTFGTSFLTQTTALKGTAGKRVPCPVGTPMLVPLTAGDGGVSTFV